MNCPVEDGHGEDSRSLDGLPASGNGMEAAGHANQPIVARGRTRKTPGASLRVSIVALRAVLAGNTYDVIAAEQGVSRTAIERRIKRLARLLHRRVGIEGLNPEAAGYAQKLREFKHEVESALGRFELGELPKESRPDRLDDDALGALIRRAALRSPAPLRDVALVHIILATGARPLEIARLQVRDYLGRDGAVRANSEMRAEVSLNHRARPLFFRNSAAVQAIDVYLASRATSRPTDKVGSRDYRGLDPSEPLFLNDSSEPYAIQRVLVDGRSRHLCRQMLETYRKIFERAGMQGVSALALRRAVAIRLDARGADEEQIGAILGISERRAVRALLPRRPGLDELMTDLYRETGPPSDPFVRP